MGTNYFISVVSAVVAGTVAELLPPDPEGSDAKPLKLLVSLLILCVIALPLIETLSAGSDGLIEELDALINDLAAAESSSTDAYAAQTMAYIREAGAEAAEGEIVRLLVERFGLPADRVRAEVTLGEGAEGITLAGVKIYLSGVAVFADPYAIEDYLGALFGGVCTVVIE